MNGRKDTLVVVRRSGDGYSARTATGPAGYRRAASSTSSAYFAALAAAAKFFKASEARIVLSYQDDTDGKISFRAVLHRTAVKFLEIEFEDKGQDFVTWVIVRDTGHIVDCRPFQYTTWAKCQVIGVPKLKVGARPLVAFPDGERRTLNYAVTKITAKGGES